LIGNILDVLTLCHNEATNSEMKKPKEKTLVNASQYIKKQLLNPVPESIGFRGSPINHTRNQYVNDQNNSSEIMSNRGMWIPILY